MTVFDNVKNILLKKRSLWILIIIAILAAWLMIRSCSKGHVPRKQLYVIGRDSTWYPEDLMGKERNLQAFTNDLFNAVGQETKLRFAWLEAASSSLVDGLGSDLYDAILSSMQPNFLNQNKYLFSELIFQLGPVLIVRKDSTATSLADMQKKMIGIPNGFNFIFNTIKKSGANAYNMFVIPYANMNKALESLDRNQMDGIIMDVLPAYAYIEGFYSDKLKVVTPPLNDEGLRLVTLKDQESQELINEFNQALETLKKNGTYDKLLSKWNLIDPETQHLKKHK